MTRTTLGTFRAWALATAGAAALNAAAYAEAQAGTLPENPVDYQIGAETLGEALELFALQSDVEVFSPSPLVTERQVSPLSERMTPVEALERLLEGTGLSYHVNEHDTVVIGERTASAEPAAHQGGSSSALQSAALPAAGAESEQSAAALEAPAQELEGEGVVSGRVTDAASGGALPGATVRLVELDRDASSDRQGFYRFSGVPAGRYTLAVDYIGMPSRTVSVTVEDEETAQASVALTDTEVITVQGYRSSLARALAQQRAAANSATIVSADLLGSFPAESVSEALRRLPGVAFARDAETGEGSAITVRGFTSEAINIKLNGVELPGTGFERTIDLSGVLGGNISQITIQKSLLPSMEASGSGGLVEIETRSGLDYDEPTLDLSIEREQHFEGDFGSEYQINGTGAYQFTPTFGVVGTLQYRDTDRKNVDVGISGTVPYVLPAGFTSATLIPSSNSFPFDPEFDDRLLTGGNYQFRDRDESNLTASLNFAWDIADHTRLTLDIQHIDRDAANTASRSTIGFLGASVDAPIPELDDEVRRRTFVNSFRPTYGVVDRNISTQSTTASLRGQTDLGRWEFDYQAGFSRAVSETENLSVNVVSDLQTDIVDLIDPGTIEFGEDALGNQRVTDGAAIFAGDYVAVPSLSAAGIDRMFDASRAYVSGATYSITDSPTEEMNFEGSARYNFVDSFLEYVETGGKYRRSDRENLDGTFATTVAGIAAAESYTGIFGNYVYLDEFGFNALPSRSLGDIGADGYDVAWFTAEDAYAVYDQLPGLVDDGRFNYTNRLENDPITDGNALEPSETVEENFAGYAEGKMVFGRLELAGGLRYERNDRSGTSLGTPTFRDATGVVLPREVLVDAGLVRFETNASTEDTWTPSALATWRQNEQLVARLGYFRSTVNPDFRNISREPQYLVYVNETAGLFSQAGFIRESNPDLQPQTTDNFDLDVAYYFTDNPGLIRFSAFFKDTSNNFTNVLLADEQEDIRQRLIDYFAPLEEYQPGISDLPEDLTYYLNRPQNGEGGYIWGVEAELIRQLDFLPGFLSDFGVLFNLTYTDGDFPTTVSGRDENSDPITLTLDRPLADQARWAGTASVNYERGPFDARLIYTYQSVTVDDYSPVDLNTVTPEYDTLDFRANYQLERWGNRFSIFVQGDDLLNGPYDADVRSATASTYGLSDADFFFPNTVQFRGGRRFTVGARATF